MCAIGPNADFLVRDHHLTAMPWGKDSPFCRLTELDARMLGIGAGFNFMTPLHTVGMPALRRGSVLPAAYSTARSRYRWKRANGETGEHEFMRADRRHPAAPVAPSFRPGYLRRGENIEFEDACRGC